MRGVSRIIVCAECGATAPNKARGICVKCYMRKYTQPVITCSACGENVPHYAKGECKRCYLAKWKSTPEQKKRHAERERERIKTPERKETRKRYVQTEEFKMSIRKSSIRYYEENKEVLREKNKQYRMNNIERIRHNINAYKTKRRGLPATLTVDEWKQILKFYNNLCAYCGQESNILHKEHKIPVSRGGGYTRENIVPACPSCNSSKRSKTPEEFEEYLKIKHEAMSI